MSATDNEEPPEAPEPDDDLMPPQGSPAASSVRSSRHGGSLYRNVNAGQGYAVNFGRAGSDFLGPRSESGHSAEDANVAEQALFGGDEPPDHEEVSNCHVSNYEDYHEIYMCGLPSRPPSFYQLPGHGWAAFKELYPPDEDGNVSSFLPVRSMVINIPIEVWSSDASRMVDWCTPNVGAERAANLAAMLGLLYTPLSKGWL